MSLILKGLAWIVGLAILTTVAVFGINATDEELSAAARKFMAETPHPVPAGEKNGYTDFLALSTSKFDQRLRRSCGAGDLSGCLKYAAENPDVVKLAGQNDEFAARYRTMRAKPEFVEAYKVLGPDDPIPAHVAIIWGQGRVQLVAASRSNRGDLNAAITELELENAFHRREAAGAQSLMGKMVAIAVLNRDAFFASELARLPAVRTAELKRLGAIVRPLSDSELDLRKALTLDAAQQMSWMTTRNYVRVSDEALKYADKLYGLPVERPWWDRVAPYLYRPNQGVNRYAAQIEILIGVAAAPITGYAEAARAARAKARTLAPRGPVSLFVNPAGNRHMYLAALHETKDDAHDVAFYIGRSHALRAEYSMVALQISLRMAGITSLDAIRKAKDGPQFKSHLDPFTGKPMHFDERTRTIGFDPPLRLSGPLEELQKRYGRVAVELFTTDRKQ